MDDIRKRRSWMSPCGGGDGGLGYAGEVNGSIIDSPYSKATGTTSHGHSASDDK